MALICAEHQRGCDQFVKMSLLKKRIPRRRNWECGTCNYLHQLRWILKTWAPSLSFSCSNGALRAECISWQCLILWALSPSSPLPTMARIIRTNMPNFRKKLHFRGRRNLCVNLGQIHKQIQLKAGRTCWNIFVLTSVWNVLKWPFLRIQNRCKFSLDQD